MPQQKPLVLVVDDDPALVRLVSLNLELDGYQVLTAASGSTAIDLMQKEQPSLVLLDVMMPGMDGFQTCQRIRDFTAVPIIMITAKGGVEDVVHGLDIGADDYITKPFSITEMLARVKAVLQRAKFPQETAQPPFVSSQLCIDFAHHQVTLAGEEIMLPPTEYRILCLLARNAGRVITHDQLLTEVWGKEYRGDTHILQVAVARLRKKLGDDSSNPKYVATRPGIGYTLRKPKETPAPSPGTGELVPCAGGSDDRPKP
jgi:DNA-binding response OmpR family regulator